MHATRGERGVTAQIPVPNWLAPTALAAVLACTGEVGSLTEEVGGPPAPVTGPPAGAAPDERSDRTGFSAAPASCQEATYAPGTVRLLTPVEYANTLRALATRFSPTPISFVELDTPEAPPGFKNGAERLELSAEYTETVTRNAERLAREIVANRARIHPGCAGAAAEADCAGGLLATVGAAAFRRPLTAAEQGRLAQRFALLRRTWGFAESLQGLMEVVLGAPQVIHRAEIGEPVLGRAGLRQLTPHELASALSYAVTLGPPDAELARAADQGLLREPREIAAQLARLVEQRRAVDGLARFFVELLAVDRVVPTTKDPKLFPFYAGRVPALLLESFTRSAAGLAAGREVTLADVFASREAWVRRELAPLFDLTSAEASFTQQTLAPVRAGIFTHPAFLAAVADELHPKPLHRARFVLEGALCVALPPPPPEADEARPPDDPTLTPRQKFAVMTSAPACIGCHRLVNPLGYPFESFDAVGRHRTRDGAHAVDPSGVLPLAGGELAFRDARDLFDRLGREPVVRECFVSHWYTYLLGREVQKADDCSRQQSFRAFERSGWKLQVLLESVFTSDSFRLRRGA